MARLFILPACYQPLGGLVLTMQRPRRRRGPGLPRLSRLYQFRWSPLWKRGRPTAHFR